MVMMHSLWSEWLAAEMRQPYFQSLADKIAQADRAGPVYPPAAERFAALALSPRDVKVVILGQDPYHGHGQAHGLSFSVCPGVRIPHSLARIYKELDRQGFVQAAPRDGCLSRWADQGVLLLNNLLSVADGQPRSHAGWGWERFTDAIIQALNARRDRLVFILWGKDAASKASTVDPMRHLILTAPHPAARPPHAQFAGNGHFRKANDYLMEHGQTPIVW